MWCCHQFLIEHSKGNYKMLNPAQRLLPGTELDNGWVVVEAIQPQDGDTGGCFSERYKVTNGEKSAFLKAMDTTVRLSIDQHQLAWI